MFSLDSPLSSLYGRNERIKKGCCVSKYIYMQAVYQQGLYTSLVEMRKRWQKKDSCPPVMSRFPGIVSRHPRYRVLPSSCVVRLRCLYIRPANGLPHCHWTSSSSSSVKLENQLVKGQEEDESNNNLEIYSGIFGMFSSRPVSALLLPFLAPFSQENLSHPYDNVPLLRRNDNRSHFTFTPNSPPFFLNI